MAEISHLAVNQYPLIMIRSHPMRQQKLKIYRQRLFKALRAHNFTRPFLILLFILESSSLLHCQHVNAQTLMSHGLPELVEQELMLIEEAIQMLVGSRVFWDDGHKFCQDGLLGVYIPSYDTMINCVANHNGDYVELLMTAKHEGWHAVQVKCNNNRAALRDDQIRPHLMGSVKDTLRHSYHPSDHRAEAEARVVEQIPTTNWIRGVKAYCGHRNKSD